MPPPKYSAPIDPYQALAKEAIFHAKQFAQAGLTAYNANSPDECINQSKAKAQYDLKDPDSAQFRNIALKDFGNGKILCGELNAKNSYGGYVGYKKFIATPLGVVVAAEPENQYANPAAAQLAKNAGIHEACQP